MIGNYKLTISFLEKSDEVRKQRDSFTQMVNNFNDPDFWRDYNIIEPTESLEKAIKKLKKK